jgi:putative membrane protein
MRRASRKPRLLTPQDADRFAPAVARGTLPNPLKMHSLSTQPALAGAAAVLAAMALVAALHDFGPHARHMGFHIVAMNIAAPLLAAPLARCVQRSSARGLWLAALGQVGLLWAAHLPAIQNAAMHGPAQVALHGILLLAALLFWLAVLALPSDRRWHALAALLLTGKLVCLLAALLVFAPRTLYGGHHAASVDDQQLAALLMITACPLSYLVAAVVIASALVRPE